MRVELVLLLGSFSLLCLGILGRVVREGCGQVGSFKFKFSVELFKCEFVKFGFSSYFLTLSMILFTLSGAVHYVWR